MRLDARLFAPLGLQPASKPGLKPKKGKRLPYLKTVLADPQTIWTALTIDWYGGERRCVEIVSGCALWHTSGYDLLPIRWVLVLVRDPLGKFTPGAFFATEQNATPTQILIWFILRWNVEVTF